ncbi:MAG: LapA family protein [Acetobacter syzygii]|mgnify:FL=1|uniref:LapA family protein n=1 Tax=Acetobacter syzygii TaxID=146476 RepID=UPI00242C0004|nr:LapA family protein [Acetobacter syzygii]
MIRLIIVVPFLLALVVFSASNQDPQDMWMLTYSWKCSLGVLALSVGALSFLLGAFCLWVVEFRQGRRARKAEQQVRDLEAQLAQVKAILANRPAVGAAPPVEQPVVAPQPHLTGSEEQTNV